MLPKIKAKKISSKIVHPVSDKRLNSMMAKSERPFQAPGYMAVMGVIIFFAAVVLQIIIIN